MGQDIGRLREGHRLRDDLLVVGAILAAALVIFLLFQGRTLLLGEASAEQTGPYAVVANTEGTYEVLPLSQDTTLDVSSDLGENLVAVHDGAVYIASSDCRNQTCVGMGTASKAGDTIICLPHHLVIQVVDDPADAYPVG